MTGTLVSPETTLGSAPSIPAATTRQSGSKASSSFNGAARRWMPATPTSGKLFVETPISRATASASSSAGRSDVPPESAPTRPPEGSGAPSPGDERAAGGTQRDFGEGFPDPCFVLGGVAADDHTSAGLQERGADLRDLGRGFARGVDDLGDALAVLASGVEDGERIQGSALRRPGDVRRPTRETGRLSPRRPGFLPGCFGSLCIAW